MSTVEDDKVKLLAVVNALLPLAIHGWNAEKFTNWQSMLPEPDRSAIDEALRLLSELEKR